MDKPTEAQIKEFWEWCGWVNEITRTPPLNIFGGDTIYNWTRPDKVIHYKELPPIDLNNLFKYAVPKLLASDRYSIKIYSHKANNEVQIIAHYYEDKSYSAGNPDLALALFWALWKVKEKSNG